MKKHVYDSIIDDLKQLTEKHGVNEVKLIIDILVDKYALDFEQIYSLISYEFRREFPNKYSNRNVNLYQIYQEWNDNKTLTLLELARKYNVSAYPLLRFIVGKISENKTLTKQWLKDPNYCTDGRLAYEIMEINSHDYMNGIYVQFLNHNAGKKFEKEINDHLRSNNISFQTEQQLRERNFDVTPDFCLNLPLICIKNEENNYYLYRINDLNELKNKSELFNDEEKIKLITWIECKSMFASIDCHVEYYQQQYESYINRFGNGIVLYQNGFVDLESIPSEYHRDLIIMQQMPPFGSL